LLWLSIELEPEQQSQPARFRVGLGPWFRERALVR
jgi:hypothetical protein